MNTIIELKSVYDYTTEEETEKSIYESVVGYYSSIDKAIKQMKVLTTKDNNYVMFLVSEYILDDISDDNDTWTRWIKECQYKCIDSEIVMTHESNKIYNGFVADEFSYKPGDIIEYIGFKDTVYQGIVGYTPPTVEEIEKRRLIVDDTDDCYLVYALGDGDTHDHVRTNYIIGYADVSPEIYKQYKDKLKERNEVNGKR